MRVVFRILFSVLIIGCRILPLHAQSSCKEQLAVMELILAKDENQAIKRDAATLMQALTAARSCGTDQDVIVCIRYLCALYDADTPAAKAQFYLDLLREGEKVADQTNQDIDPYHLGFFFYQYAFYFDVQEKLPLAIDYYHKALQEWQKTPRQDLVWHTTHNIAENYRRLGNNLDLSEHPSAKVAFQSALDWYLNSYNQGQQIPNHDTIYSLADRIGMATSLCHLGLDDSALNILSPAINLIEDYKSIHHCESAASTGPACLYLLPMEISFYMTQGNIWEYQNQLEKAYFSYRKAYDQAREYDTIYPDYAIHSTYLLANICKSLDSSKQAFHYLNEGLQLLAESPLQDDAHERMLYLATELYALEKDSGRAFSFLQQRNAIQNDRLSVALSLSQAYEDRAHTSETERMKTLEAKRSLLLKCIIGFLVLGVMFMMLWAANRRKQFIQEAKNLRSQKEKEVQELFDSMKEGVFQARSDALEEVAIKIHNDWGQSLTSCRYNLAYLERLVQAEDPAIKQEFKETTQLLTQLEEEARSLSRALSSKSLSNNLKTELEAFSHSFNRKHPAPTIRTHFQGNTHLPLPNSFEYSLYSMIQEAVKNALRHGSPQNIDIQVFMPHYNPGATQQAEYITVSIVDDGEGFNPKLTQKGVGTHALHTLSKQHGGTSTIKSNIGAGTEVIIELPLPHA